ncbi:phage tail spike protein [Oceanobacillus alkalisoli]|uniref:phage tail spike protein n=1 Tax=Oceanobacillus alkalisoli TaxID=2925113 RepID=UPI001EE3D5E0|nr:phage tail spike protein [Oceanobacillus alkalisoli]MCG5104458.1 phage tail protein [Oceanobacillus alkalisoli]
MNLEKNTSSNEVITIIKTLNLNRQTTAILENAYNIGYEKEVNAIWQASFSLPLNDPKVEKVELLKYVEITDEDEYIGLFRIIPKQTRKNSEANYVQFHCEHVLATLMDSSLFKYHQLTNYTTDYVLEYLLNQQNHKHWNLGQVDFTRYFHYSWENENVITALFSVPLPFNEQYIWTWDTQSYPWTLNLVRPEMEPTCRIKEGYNLRTLEIEENPMSLYNRIYPLGAGEGVNQLTIESINNGVPYLEDIQPGEEIKEVVWVDQRFTDVESLKASAQALLDKWKKPIVTWKIGAAEVSKITGLSVDKFKAGAVVRMQLDDFPTTDLRIMRESKSDIKGDPGNAQLEIDNVQEDLASTNADLERRQQVNELYSQGATNILNFTYQDNADAEMAATIPFYLDNDVVNINTVELTYRTRPFRAYSQATEGGGAIVGTTKGGGGTTRSTTEGGGTTATSSSGGGSQQTSSSGGGTSRSTNSGGGSSQTSAAGGDHTHVMFSVVGYEGVSNGDQVAIAGAVNDQGSRLRLPGDTGSGSYRTQGSSGNHQHSVTIPAHSHEFSTPNHTHSVNIPAHTHDLTIPAHSHEVTIPEHTHEIELPNHTHEVRHGIYELNEIPSSVLIKVDGNVVPHESISGDRIDLVDYMSKDSNGRITRGRHEVEILPDGLARIEADLILRVFIQSQLGEVF